VPSFQSPAALLLTRTVGALTNPAKDLLVQSQPRNLESRAKKIARCNRTLTLILSLTGRGEDRSTAVTAVMRKRSAARFSETGTGCAYAQLSEARSSRR
jgi:hypothetical protein